MVTEKLRKEHKYDCEELADEWRYGFKAGYTAGLRDGKWMANHNDGKEDVQ
jgi:hypothetical protein